MVYTTLYIVGHVRKNYQVLPRQKPVTKIQEEKHMQKQTEEVEILELLNTEFKIFAIKMYNDLDYKIQNFKNNCVCFLKNQTEILNCMTKTFRTKLRFELLTT